MSPACVFIVNVQRGVVSPVGSGGKGPWGEAGVGGSASHRGISHACSTDGCEISFHLGSKISKLILSQIIVSLSTLPTLHRWGALPEPGGRRGSVTAAGLPRPGASGARTGLLPPGFTAFKAQPQRIP